MLREEDNILSNPVSGTETNRGHDVIDFPACIAILPSGLPLLKHPLPEEVFYVRFRKL
ncbi:hypothetical protein AVEN_197879-1, partial [Araneus ventricosus]